MKQSVFTIKENTALTPWVYRMVLLGDTSAVTAAGQFVQVSVPGKFLRRPISVCDVSEGILTLIYKNVGEGTALMSRMEAGETLDILTGLGNGYDLSLSGEAPVLLGGGVGVPPLYKLCKNLLAEGKHPSVILGFNTSDEIFLEDDFKALGVPVTVATADGSCGVKGFATTPMKDMSYTYFYACGPKPMLHAIALTAVTEGQYSLEERMGCGFGACMGCTIETKLGPKRVCKEGPVFKSTEVEV